MERNPLEFISPRCHITVRVYVTAGMSGLEGYSLESK
jgi:hypothetical protein